jgi:hypothetical protein
LLAFSLALCSVATAHAQVVPFTSSANVTYSIQGLVLQAGLPMSTYNDFKNLTTNNPLAEPIQVSGSIGGTLSNAGGSATLSANVSAVGSAGLMRATFDGSTTASWASSQSAAGLSPSSVTVRWTDAFIFTGNPADPQPGRTLVVQSFFNLSGSIDASLTEPALEFGNDYASSFLNVSLKLAAHDNFGRSLISGNEFAVESGATKPGSSVSEAHITAPSVVPVQMLVVEGSTGSMTVQMQITANAGSSTGSQYFGADRTATTFNADFGHTLTWGGITSVTDQATGLPVTGWSITSASGVDYANAVPEPTSAATLLALVAPALLLGRRTRAMSS